jgi:GGDEF domain-containing protein
LTSPGLPGEAELPETVLGDSHIQVLGALGAAGFARAEDLYEFGLDLLVRHLGVDRAMVASVTARGLESLWCAEGGARPLPHDPNLNFCAQVVREPAAALVIEDAAADPAWADHPACRTLGIRAYLGAALRFSGKPMGVLSVQSRTARSWQPSDVALVNVVAALFGKAMEVEALKVELAQAKEVLDLTAAVMEDHALENPRTGLPSRRYLEVWCKSHLLLARRRREVITLVTWIQPAKSDRAQTLARLAGSLRGVDLMVDLGRDRFLLVLPRTLRAGAETVLERFRRILGPRPMGATLWNPLLNPDRQAATLQPAIRRAQSADPGGQGTGEVVWTLLEPSRENILGETDQW